MPFNMEYFRKQAELKKQAEQAKLAEENKKVEEETQQVVSENEEYYKFHVNDNASVCKHYPFAEECLVPYSNSTDTQRGNMYDNHVVQTVHIKNPEFPKVFTNFEDQVGEYSIAYKKAPENLRVIKKIVKNDYNYDLIVQNNEGVYDIIHYNVAKNITEDYGYKLNDCVPDVKEGDTIPKDSFIYKSDNYDDDGNFMLGVNLKAVYYAYKNMTYEDGAVISRSAAEKLVSYKVERTMVSINGNDILINLYGDKTNFKSFPKIGEHTSGNVLVASRRKDKRTSLYELQEDNIVKINQGNDDVTYSNGGIVVDIDVYNNIPIQELRKRTDVFNKEILEIVENNYRYWNEMAQTLEEIIPCKELTDHEMNSERNEFGHVCKHPIDRDVNENKYTDEVGYYWKLAHEYIDEKILWRHDGKSFDNVKLMFTILKENHLCPGSKISGRYGNKGIVAYIVDDEKMPITEDGVRAEILLNPLGVVNRLNPSQIKEQHINFMSDHVIKLMKEAETYQEKETIFFDYLKALNKKEYDFYDIEYIGMNRIQKREFLDEVMENGIYVHEPPFFGNTTHEQFIDIYKDHPEWCTPYKFVGVEEPMVMGDIYFIKLKHESSNKASARSDTTSNSKNLPAKTSLKKEKKVLISQTPIKMGEMEVTNLMLTKKPEMVEKFLKTYSTNEELRKNTTLQLLNPGKTENNHMKNSLNMDIEADLRNNKSISREILDKYMNVLGYSIIDDIDEETE